MPRLLLFHGGHFFVVAQHAAPVLPNGDSLPLSS